MGALWSTPTSILHGPPLTKLLSGRQPLDPHYLPPHYREDYRLAIDALVEDDLEGYYAFLQGTGVVDFLCQPEVEHIKRTLQVPCESSLPELPYVETDADGSSDTYWPVHSDLEAPALDLGWPQNNLMGPTEVTTLVNPSDRNMPSIKEHARRLIKNAQQVIAVVMDMFTDIDLFSDLLDATLRNVAVYILLDEQNSHNFTTMVSNCKVNLERVHLMRVRTVPGTTYFCRTGKSFKGQMMDRFMLVDCRVVLTGNYSFMWSFEKIHRCMAHLFLGELVTTFDEEFRILYAQSEPMVVENALVPLPGESSYSSQRTPSFRNPRGCLPLENTLYGGHFGHPFGDKMNMHPFRRVDHFQSSLETMQMQMHSSKQSHKLLKVEQGRSMMASREMEMSYKRHSYAEGSHESYAASRQFMKHQVMNNLEEVEAQSSYLFSEQHHYQGHGPGSGRGVTDKMKSQGYSHREKYLDSGNPLELEPPDTYGYVADYLSSSSSKDVFHDTKEMAPGEGVYGGGSLKRGNMGQSYVCQTSPTQLHPPDQRPPFRESSCDRQPQEPGMKQGLRKWRINSYLSAYEDAAEDPMPPPLGPDPFDEPPGLQTRQFPGLAPKTSQRIPNPNRISFHATAGRTCF
ncbi:hypothetical protein AGOR_G00113840 [Albula goreensis]|uniref:Scaffolding anchor of CK1 domain-containing protein n=1 Tax=Albula goreensis TaxID=1534307 RepID=A0A8T3DDC7_9TELE|nr:hypothetical protein AGOR_G00113840 [Albula goreensis]